MSIDIGNRLAIYGWKKEDEDFFFILAKVWWTLGHQKTFRNVEQLLFHPTKGALPFIADVREMSGLVEMPEEDILQTLNNLRKNGYLKAAKEWIG